MRKENEKLRKEKAGKKEKRIKRDTIIKKETFFPMGAFGG